MAVYPIRNDVNLQSMDFGILTRKRRGSSRSLVKLANTAFATSTPIPSLRYFIISCIKKNIYNPLN